MKAFYWFVVIPEPTRKGYIFVEWNTSKDSSGNSYQAGNEIEINSMTLYAISEKDVATPSDAGKRATVSEADRKATDFDADYADDMVIPDLEIYCSKK